MNINKTSNTNFNGTVHMEWQARYNDTILRPLIKHIKHNCGHKDVHYYIDVCDTDNSLQSLTVKYDPKEKFNKYDGYVITYALGIPKTKENIKKVIEKTKESMWYFQNIRNQEKEFAKKKEKPEVIIHTGTFPKKEPFWKKLFPFLK